MVIDAREQSLPIAYVNSTYEQMSDYCAAELEGTSWRTILAADDSDPEVEKVRRAIGCGEPCEATIPYVRKNGTTWLADVGIRPLSGGRGETRYFLCEHAPAAAEAGSESDVQVDLLQRALGQARQKIVSLSSTDPVSGLLRYEHFLALLRREIGTSSRDRRLLSLLVLDIVELEIYRQTFGANAADSCVRMIGAQIAGVFRRAGDLAARCDTGTFVVAVPGQSAEQIAGLGSRVADKVRDLGLHNPRARSGRYLCVRSAVGEADDGEEADALVTRVRDQLSTPSAAAAAQG